MEIILLERVESLGQMGDLVTVKPGYARNYLLPQGKALRATPENRERFETERAQLEAENLARKSEAEAVGKKMEGLNITLVRAASEMGQLYGSASSRDIAESITTAGFTVSRNQVGMDAPMKTLGLFDIRINLHPEVSVDVKVNVARSEDEAAEQLRLGRAIISDIAEREREEAAEAARASSDRIAKQEAEDGVETAIAADADNDTADDTAEAPSAKPKPKAKSKAKAKTAATDDTADAPTVESKAKAKPKAKSKSKAKAKAKTDTADDAAETPASETGDTG
jgi:large subunit ribosomal protein L9